MIDTFTEAWERGEAPVVEDYLHHLDPADSQGAVELIYREYCLAEADGRGPDPSLYLARFPQHREALERLLQLHGECPTSLLGRWFKPPAAEADLPEAGDSIGPYLLRRELGRGSFARVFLAEEADLENRLDRGQSLDAGDARALAAGPGTARPHRRDRVAHPG